MRNYQSASAVIRSLKQKASWTNCYMPASSKVDVYRSTTGSLYFIITADVWNPALRDMTQVRHVRVSNHQSHCDKLYGNVVIEDRCYNRSDFKRICRQVFRLVYKAGLEVQAEVNANRGLFRKERKLSKVC